MHLKSLKIYGFKSFADKIEIKFSSGITAIVGPNGSGKSNISDSIRWVLGEQSMKSLRGSSSEDVIFTGTELRDSLSFAEVSLTINNSQRYLDIDFDTVQITRKIFRDGENIFYINNTPCRLKDINQLLLNTGIGRGGYSVISQGKIDDILSQNNENRRLIFEEASGISKYRHQVDESKRKLHQTEENLLRINDIMSEINTQLIPLKRQADNARMFLSVSDKLKKAESFFALQKIDKLNINLNEHKKNIDSFSNDYSLAKSNLENLERENEKISLKMNELNLNINYSKERQKQLEIQFSQCENNILVDKQKLNSQSDIVKKNKINIETNKSEQEDLETASVSLNIKIAETEKEIPPIENDLQQLNSQLSQSMYTNKENKERILDLNKQINDCTQNLIKLNAKQSSLSTSLMMIQDQLIQLNEEKTSVFEEININSISFYNKVFEIKTLSRREERFFQLKKNLGKTVSDLQHNFNDNKSNLQKQQEILSQKDSRKKFIQNIKLNFELYNKTTKYILKWKEKIGADIFGSVAEIIDPPREYITAVEAILGTGLQNIITKTQSDAKKIILHLKQNNIGKATFLPVDVIKSSECDMSKIQNSPGVLGIASRLIGVKSTVFDNILKYLLGRVVIIDNIDNAMFISKKYSPNFRMVTLSGEVFNQGGAVTGGSHNNKSNSLLSLDYELKSLSKEIELIENDLEEKKKIFISLSSNIDENNHQIKILDENIAKIGIEKKSLYVECSSIKKYLNTLDSKKYKNEMEASSLTEKKETTFSKLEIVNEHIKQGDTILKQLNEELKLLNDSEHEYNSWYEECINKKNKLEILLSNKKKDYDLYKIQLSENSRKISSVIKNIKCLEDENLQIQVNTSKLLDNLSNYETLSSKIVAQIESTSENLLKLYKQDEQYKLEIQNNMKNQNEIRDLLLSVNNKISQAENLKQKSELEIENIINSMWDKYELTLSDIESLAQQYCTMYKPEDREKSSFLKLKESIKKLGNVNLDAIEEFDNLNKRFNFLKSQVDDLSKAKSDLNKIISNSLSHMEIIFKDKFMEINRNFVTIFKELFGGGRSRLTLLDENNILTSPIDIEAQPPGKSLQNIQLMSGGEKALTAIAILMAILKVNPAAFCILDEIDAALDESNVYRYMQYLKNFTEKTQFILITHKRPTMELSDILYGVTMQEKGVSKIISLELKEESK